MIAVMFEEGMSGRVCRKFDPPREVLVDASRVVIATDDLFVENADVPPWLRDEGLDINAIVPGYQSAWIRSTRGSWLAPTELLLTTGDGRGQLRVEHVCAGRWVEPVPGVTFG